jgi:transaldolase
MARHPLIALKEAGQSPWLDYLSRDLITSGKLQRMIDEDGLCGVTSNPSIFQQALARSAAYDRPLEDLLNKGLRDSRQLFFALALDDIAAAADILLPVYRAAGGGDGFVSLEVSPDLAYDTEATIEEALRLFRSLARDNVMIKVPATIPGLAAIETLTAAGVNVNVTLLFSVARYRQVIEAYLKGLERRLAAGGPVNKIASVASFFVSRVDVMIDPLLECKGETTGSAPDKERLRDLRGRAAVANARLAYQVFAESFAGNRFHALRQQGARVQRLLWGSTGTKNPAYSDIKYVQELIGADTVNTMPEETMTAFADHGKVRESIGDDLPRARALFEELAGHGIDIQVVTDRLEKEGVDKFADSFSELLQGINEKRDRFLRERE